MAKGPSFPAGSQPGTVRGRIVKAWPFPPSVEHSGTPSRPQASAQVGQGCWWEIVCEYFHIFCMVWSLKQRAPANLVKKMTLNKSFSPALQVRDSVLFQSDLETSFPKARCSYSMVKRLEVSSPLLQKRVYIPEYRSPFLQKRGWTDGAATLYKL